MNVPTKERLCELIDICRPHANIGLEVRAELRRALLELYQKQDQFDAARQQLAELLNALKLR